MNNKQKIWPGVALLAGLLGVGNFVNAGYAGEVVVDAPSIRVMVPPPPVIVVPAPGIVIGAPGIDVGLPGPGGILFGGGGYDRRGDVHNYRDRGAESRGAAHRDDHRDDHGKR
jgi:hypothetical protein